MTINWRGIYSYLELANFRFWFLLNHLNFLPLIGGKLVAINQLVAASTRQANDLQIGLDRSVTFWTEEQEADFSQSTLHPLFTVEDFCILDSPSWLTVPLQVSAVRSKIAPIKPSEMATFSVRSTVATFASALYGEASGKYYQNKILPQPLLLILTFKYHDSTRRIYCSRFLWP